MEVNAALAADAVFVAEGIAAMLRREALDQQRVGAKLRFAAAQLLLAIQNNFRTAFKAAYRAANLNVLIHQRRKVADILLILLEADNGKVAGGIRSLRAAHVQKTSVLRRMYHGVDVRRNADILVDVLQCLIGRDASLALALCSQTGQRSQANQQQEGRKEHFVLMFCWHRRCVILNSSASLRAGSAKRDEESRESEPGCHNHYLLDSSLRSE